MNYPDLREQYAWERKASIDNRARLLLRQLYLSFQEKRFAIDHRIDTENPKTFKFTTATVVQIFLLFWSARLI